DRSPPHCTSGLLGHRVLPTLECVKRRLAGAAAPSSGLGAAESRSQPPPQKGPAEEQGDGDDEDEEEEEEEEEGKQAVEEGPRQRQQRGEQQNGYARPVEVGSDSNSGDGDSGGSGSGLVEVIPAAAVVWVVGLEVLTRRVCGEDLSAVNKYRWDDKYEAVRLQDIPYYRKLTVPVQVFNFDFTQPPEDVGFGAGLIGQGTGRTRPYPSTARVDAEVISTGVLNAVAFWYDLILDEHSGERISNAPPGIFP
ncbi:hypothetical protein VaNZ11_011152, partial [Volvox africanus]